MELMIGFAMKNILKLRRSSMIVLSCIVVACSYIAYNAGCYRGLRAQAILGNEERAALAVIVARKLRSGDNVAAVRCLENSMSMAVQELYSLSRERSISVLPAPIVEEDVMGEVSVRIIEGVLQYCEDYGSDEMGLLGDYFPTRREDLCELAEEFMKGKARDAN